jgi:hypothetical protein
MRRASPEEDRGAESGQGARQARDVRQQDECSEVREVLEHIPVCTVCPPGPRGQRRRIVSVASTSATGQYVHIATPFPDSRVVSTALAPSIVRSVFMMSPGAASSRCWSPWFDTCERVRVRDGQSLRSEEYDGGRTASA